jgi:hypothetical protein
MPKKYVSTAPDAGHSKDEGGDKAMKSGIWNFGYQWQPRAVQSDRQRVKLRDDRRSPPF